MFAKNESDVKVLRRALCQCSSALTINNTLPKFCASQRRGEISNDKVIYFVNLTVENQQLVHQVVKVIDYPNGTMLNQYGYRKLDFKIFDKHR